MAPTTYKIRVDSEELEAWKKSAETAGLKLAEWMRRRCDANGDAKDVRRISEVPVAQRSVANPQRTAIDLAAVAEETVAKRTEYSSIQQRVARRTGHPVGHECMDCMGAYRFEQDLERREKQEEKPVKKGRR